MQILKTILGIGWLVFVAIFYFSNHTYYKTILGSAPKLLGFFVLMALVGAGLYWIFIKAQRGSRVLFRPIHLVLGGLIVTFLSGVFMIVLLDPGVFTERSEMVFLEDGQVALFEEGTRLQDGVSADLARGSVINNWSEAKEVFPPEIQAFFVHKNVLEFGVTLGLNLLKMLGFWMLLVILFYGLGALFVKREAYSFFRAVGLGMGICMLVIFALGVFGWLHSNVVWGVFSVLFALSLFKVKDLWGVFIHSGLEFESDQKIWNFLLIFGLLLFFGLNWIDVIAPVPIGFDSLYLYQKTPQLLVHYHHLISGIPSYNFELLNALSLLIFKSTMFSLGATFFVGVLALILLFFMLRGVFSITTSLLLVSVFASLPMVNFLMHSDLKVDLPLLFFSLLTIFCVVKWHRHREDESSKQWLIQTGIFLGIAFGMKYTSFLLIAAVFVFYGYVAWSYLGAILLTFLSLVALNAMNFSVLNSLPSFWLSIVQAFLLLSSISIFVVLWMRKRIVWSSLKPFMVTGVFIVLMFSPWLFKNLAETRSVAPHALLSGKNSEIVLDREALNPEDKACSSLVDDLSGYQQYVGHFEGSKLLSPFVILWESTINSGFKDNELVDVSFLFLGFAVFGIFAFKKVKERDLDFSFAVGFFLFYLFLWLIAGRGIVWYGMPMFLGLLYFYGRVWKEEKWPIYVVIFWLVLSFSLRATDSFQKNLGLLYAGGVTDDSIYLQQHVPGSEAVLAVLNEEDALSKKVYLVGTFLTYFIEENDRRVHFDQTMSDFKCLLRDEDPQKTLSRLREQGFGYIVYSNQALGAEKNLDGPLHEQFEWFEGFAANFLIEEVYRDGMVLYKIPES